jgi:hypothetical protein
VEGAEHLSSEAPLNLSALKRKIRLRLRPDDARTAHGRLVCLEPKGKRNRKRI